MSLQLGLLHSERYEIKYLNQCSKLILASYMYSYALLKQSLFICLACTHVFRSQYFEVAQSKEWMGEEKVVEVSEGLIFLGALVENKVAV